MNKNIIQQEIEIILPDDFHHHFRDNDYLYDTTFFAGQRFGKIIWYGIP